MYQLINRVGLNSFVFFPLVHHVCTTVLYQLNKRLTSMASSSSLWPIMPEQQPCINCLTGILISSPVLRIRNVYPGSRILIFTHPGSRISYPKTEMKDRGEKKFIVIPFFWSHKFHKIELFYFSKRKIWNNFQRIIELFTQKVVTKLSKIWVWEPGVTKAPDPGSATLLFSFSSSTPCLHIKHVPVSINRERLSSALPLFHLIPCACTPPSFIKRPPFPLIFLKQPKY
jgi:hypothetical protein